MQGLPPKDLEGYQPLLPNSPEGPPEGVVDHEIASKLEAHTLWKDLELFQTP
jgi:hypothetical protein